MPCESLSHSLSLPLSLTLSISLSVSLTLPLSPSHSLSDSLSLHLSLSYLTVTLSLSHSLAVSLTLSLSLPPPLSLSLCLSLTVWLTLSLSCLLSLPLSLSLSLSLSVVLSVSLSPSLTLSRRGDSQLPTRHIALIANSQNALNGCNFGKLYAVPVLQLWLMDSLIVSVLHNQKDRYGCNYRFSQKCLTNSVMFSCVQLGAFSWCEGRFSINGSSVSPIVRCGTVSVRLSWGCWYYQELCPQIDSGPLSIFPAAQRMAVLFPFGYRFFAFRSLCV